ncbi:kelch repeat-containing protein [Paraglaciecola sp. L3A3]|uniref:Kelch repeat-containing protein n=1 Tax=Paraglaciecola sp. L3A3 TaxID=2686358 RepID=UPI00131AC85A|nr:kelch repeat-containing protein [Paraglaciecola sp. L3A3]
MPNGLYGHAIVNNGQKIFVLAGSQKGGFSRDIHIIDPRTKEMIKLKDKLLPRRYHSAVWDGKDSIYILGGVTAWKHYSSLQPLVEIYDIPSKQVKILGEMPVPRRFASAVYIDGKIVVSGGSKYDSRQKLVPTNIVSIFDITTNQWTKASGLPFAEDTRTVILGKHIYAIGGYNNKKASNHFSRYDLTKDQWISLPSLPQLLSAHSAVAVQDKIYTFGDYKNLTSSYIYNTKTQNWSTSPFNFQASRHNAATELNGVIYVIGGTLGSGKLFLDSIQTFTVE